MRIRREGRILTRHVLILCVRRESDSGSSWSSRDEFVEFGFEKRKVVRLNSPFFSRSRSQNRRAIYLLEKQNPSRNRYQSARRMFLTVPRFRRHRCCCRIQRTIIASPIVRNPIVSKIVKDWGHSRDSLLLRAFSLSFAS